MQSPPESLIDPSSPPKRSLWGVVLLVIGVAVITSILTVWITTRYLFPREFEPVTLKSAELKTLQDKIDRLESSHSGNMSQTDASEKEKKKTESLEPEIYSEEGGARQISFTERELNGLLSKKPDLARKLVIDLSENLASAKLLIPLDPDIPLVGGKTLKVAAGLELRYADDLPVIVLRGISIWGVPLPDAWLGGIKNIDLVREFGNQQGFWNTLSEGLDDIRVEEGLLTVRLRE